jgi:hypothetical protein
MGSGLQSWQNNWSGYGPIVNLFIHFVVDTIFVCNDIHLGQGKNKSQNKTDFRIPMTALYIMSFHRRFIMAVQMFTNEVEPSH